MSKIWDIKKLGDVIKLLPTSLRGPMILLLLLLTFFLAALSTGKLTPAETVIVIVAVVLLFLVAGGAMLLIWWLNSKSVAAAPLPLPTGSSRSLLSVGDQSILGQLLALELGAISGHKAGYISSHIHLVLPSVTKGKLLYFLGRVL